MGNQIGPIPGVRFGFTVYTIDDEGNGGEKIVTGLPYLPQLRSSDIDATTIMDGLQLNPARPAGSGQWRLMTDAEIADYLSEDGTYAPREPVAAGAPAGRS
jgi:hypothetical protein